MAERVYTARESFWTNIDGRDRLVHKGEKVAADDPVLYRREWIFDVEEIKAPAPVKRGPGRPRKTSK